MIEPYMDLMDEAQRALIVFLPGGLSLRDYLAAHAPKFERFFQEPDDKYLARVVDWNCKYADAMIARLKTDRS